MTLVGPSRSDRVGHLHWFEAETGWRGDRAVKNGQEACADHQEGPGRRSVWKFISLDRIGSRYVWDKQPGDYFLINRGLPLRSVREPMVVRYTGRGFRYRPEFLASV